MREKTKLKIGEFSQMMQVTVKTLRHYEQKGLLYPCEVDEWTGYRYYSVEQMQRLNTIRQLQSLGFSLDEIKELYEEGAHAPSIEQLNDKIEKTEQQLQLLVARRSQLVNSDYAALGPLCVEKIGPEMQRLGCKCINKA